MCTIKHTAAPFILITGTHQSTPSNGLSPSDCDLSCERKRIRLDRSRSPHRYRISSSTRTRTPRRRRRRRSANRRKSSTSSGGSRGSNESAERGSPRSNRCQRYSLTQVPAPRRWRSNESSGSSCGSSPGSSPAALATFDVERAPYSSESDLRTLRALVITCLSYVCVVTACLFV